MIICTATNESTGQLIYKRYYATEDDLTTEQVLPILTKIQKENESYVVKEGLNATSPIVIHSKYHDNGLADGGPKPYTPHNLAPVLWSNAPREYVDWHLRGQVGDWVLLQFTFSTGQKTLAMMPQHKMLELPVEKF